MVETTFNLFDAVVVLVMALSIMLSFFRGFVREILSLGAWIGASIITAYKFPEVMAWLAPQVQTGEEQSMKSQLGVMVVAFAGTFMVSLFTISIINRLLLKLLRTNKDIGLLDNALGVFFGFARAALLLSLGYFTLTFVFPEENLPPWLAQSQTRPYVAEGAKILAKLAPEYLGALPKFNGEEGEEPSEFEGQILEKMLRSGTPVATPEGEKSEPNYEYMRTDQFQQLLEQLDDKAGESNNTQ